MSDIETTNQEVTRATRTTMSLGDLKLDVLQFPDGSYHFYTNQLNEVLRIQKGNSTGQKYLKPLMEANPDKIHYAKVEGIKNTVKTLSLELVLEAAKIYAGMGNQRCVEILCGRKSQARVKQIQDLYFFLSKDYGCVKIGKSSDVNRRLVGVQTGFPGKLEIFKVLKGKGNKESTYHTALKDYRLEGEWFDAGCLNILSL